MANNIVMMAIAIALLMLSFVNQGMTMWIGRPSNYPDYHIENKCSSNESLTYILEKKGLKSAAKIWSSSPLRNAGERKCTITVEIQPFSSKYGVIISVKSLHFQSNQSECSGYIKLYLEGGRTKTVCKAAEEGESYATSGKLKIEYKTSHHTRLKYKTDFLLVVTAYKRRGWFWCGFDRFQCDNRRCIWPGLTCDGYDNCGDNSDEFDFGRSHCHLVRQYNCKHWKDNYNLDCDDLIRATESPIQIIDLADETTKLTETTTHKTDVGTPSETPEFESTTERYLTTPVVEEFSDITLNNTNSHLDQTNGSVASATVDYHSEKPGERFELGVQMQRKEVDSRKESEGETKRAYVHILTIVGGVVLGMAAVGATTCCFVWYRVTVNKKKFSSDEGRPLAVAYVKSHFDPPPKYEI